MPLVQISLTDGQTEAQRGADTCPEPHSLAATWGEGSQAKVLLPSRSAVLVRGILGWSRLGCDVSALLQALQVVAEMKSPLEECAKGEPFHIVTPLLESWALSQVAGMPVFLKYENVQPTGSFKIRGIGHLCQEVRAGGEE